ncbi:CHAT domain-containing protein [Oculatella sp. LEGE 06141]|uniref:CHAT domain-containing protein n=1 Tax=Oculatella sp. LEGE 06141 TaxID=1828648 RepID=UPI00188249A6|nr:CHAT domain-containing protein [Oculatella sp. LEGE 06141]MBE9182053.1 CHAT domain-containing protein [Oculatella sp. LEGE 06141]
MNNRSVGTASYRFVAWLLVGFLLFCGLNFSQQSSASTPIEQPALIQQGRLHYQAGQFAQAAEFWQQSAAAQNDPLNQARILGYLALAQQQLGAWDDTKRSIATSLDLLQSIPSSAEQQLVLAQISNTQASLEYAQGQTEQAIDTWRQASALYAAAGDQEKRIGSLLNQVQALQTLGLYSQARQLLSEIEQSLQTQPDSALKAMSLRNLGNVLRATGNFTTARRVLQQSLAILQSVSPSDLGPSLISLGNVAQSEQETDLALQYYQQAATNATPLIQLQANLNQLSLLVKTQRWDEARSLLPTIQPLLNLPPSRVIVYAQINFGRSLMQFEHPDPAAIVPILTQAIRQAQSLKDVRAEAYALGNLGSLYEQTQQWDEARRLTERSLLLAQTANASDIAYQWQWQLGRILKAQDRVEDAIVAYQAAYETQQSLRADLLATSPDLQFSFRESVEPVYRDLVELLLRRSIPSSSASQENLRQARQVIESLQLAELDNFFRTACLEGQRVTIDQIPQTNAAVIYPIILQNRLEVILSLPGQALQQYTAIVPQATVESTLRDLRQNLEKPFTTIQGKQLGQQVYDWLIHPIESDLQAGSITTLAFVLDGALRNVPMAALYDGNQYLIENYSIALTPGLQIFRPQTLERDRLRALVAGLSEERGGFSALANVEQELQAIEAEIPSRVLLNQTFTSEALKAQIDRTPTPIVHLATHGQFSSNADQTFILAWDRPIEVQEFGSLLRSADDRREAIELLVLSACETAAGDDRAALGLAGVAVHSGARSTLASLWSLNDESAARFIRQFYQELLNPALSKTEALRQAQLTLLRNPNYRSPLYWAAYVLIGNWL